ncbi:SMI1/KNR4 family protein [Microbispora sp. NPDC049125]|uniref:SMI1/KNR4 family protein n=1 Tax=Microbispora sp. NPDC049125 TaxID=3154929 RepID=UPI0034658E2C
MILDGDRDFPPALTAVAGVTFEFTRDGGVDYEPYEEFPSTEETTAWFRAWTGNAEVSGDAFRVFGQDGTGGLAAFWLVLPEKGLADQPIVFFGSEGDRGVIARDLGCYLWLLADGFGPFEAVAFPDQSSRPNPEMTAIAEQYAPDLRKPAKTVIREAAEEFPHFNRMIEELCR